MSGVYSPSLPKTPRHSKAAAVARVIAEAVPAIHWATMVVLVCVTIALGCILHSIRGEKSSLVGINNELRALAVEAKTRNDQQAEDRAKLIAATAAMKEVKEVVAVFAARLEPLVKKAEDF